MEYYGTNFWAPTNALSHYGIKGQKWGVRRWQNADGTFNEAGKKRYFGNGGGENYKKIKKNNKQVSSISSKTNNKISDETKEKLKKAAIIGGSVAAVGLAAYGAYKLNGLATTQLQMGDLAYGRQQEMMAKMALKNFVDQNAIANDYSYKLHSEGIGRRTGKTTEEINRNIDLWNKHDKMVENAKAASSRYTDYSKKADKAFERAKSGKYTAKEKMDALQKWMYYKKWLKKHN